MVAKKHYKYLTVSRDQVTIVALLHWKVLTDMLHQQKRKALAEMVHQLKTVTPAAEAEDSGTPAAEAEDSGTPAAEVEDLLADCGSFLSVTTPLWATIWRILPENRKPKLNFDKT